MRSRRLFLIFSLILPLLYYALQLGFMYASRTFGEVWLSWGVLKQENTELEWLLWTFFACIVFVPLYVRVRSWMRQYPVPGEVDVREAGASVRVPINTNRKHGVGVEIAGVRPAMRLTPRGIVRAAAIGIGLSGASTLIAIALLALSLDADMGVLLTPQKVGMLLFATASKTSEVLTMILGGAILTAILEEILFRGIVFQAVHRYLSFTASIWVVALYFAVWHFSIFQSLAVFPVGFGLTVLYATTRHLGFSIVAHIMNNLVVTAPTLWVLTDAYFYGNIAIRCVFLVVAVVLLYRGYRNR